MKKKMKIPKNKLAQYDLVVSKVPGMERKGGVSLPYTSMKGNMYTMMRKDGVLGIRLGKNDREDFIEALNTVPFENYGSQIREYVEVPDSILMDTELMLKYMKMSHEYAKTLKPKATKKSAKNEKKDKGKTEENKATDLVGETYRNGQVKSDIKGDILTHYFVDGTIKAQGRIVKEKMDGKWIFNKKDGSLWQIGNFKEDIKDGEWIRYDSKGEIAYHVEFKDGKIIKKLY